MLKIKIIFLFIIHISFLSQISSQDDNTANYIPILLKIFQSLEYKCYPDIEKVLFNERNITESNRSYPWILDIIGKGLNDIGDESECITTLENTSFIMMFFNNLTMANVIRNNDIQLYNFLELKGYAMGICIMNNCKKTIYRYAKLITKFAIYLDTNNVPENKDIVTFFENDRTDPNSENNVFFDEKLATYKERLVILIILLIFICLKILGGIFRLFILPKGYDKYMAEIMNKSKRKNTVNDLEENLNLFSKKKYKIEENLNDEGGPKEYNPLFDFTDKLPLFIKILKAFDILDDLYLISSKRNKYFNDTGLDVINFNRAITICFIIFVRTYYTLISLPTEEIINKTFFKSQWNILVQLSSNALVCWILLEGAHTTYKLLSYISSEMFRYCAKDESHKPNIYIKLIIIFGKFLLLIIPKIIMFYCIYYLIYYKVEEFTFLADAKATFTYMMKNIFKKDIECESGTTLFNWKIFSFDYENYCKCYEHIHFFFNMFLSLIVSMILIYLFILIKNVIFEILIIVINFALFFSLVTFVEDRKNENNDDSDNIKLFQYHMNGQNYMTKIFFLFLTCYILGFFIGFILFNLDGSKNKINKLIYENYLNYFSKNTRKIENDSESNSKEYISLNDNSSGSFNDSKGVDNLKKVNNTNINYTDFQLPYYPFLFLNKGMIWLKKKSFTAKIISIFVCIILFIGCDLFKFVRFINEKNETFDIKLDGYYRYAFMYEKIGFLFFYSIMIMIMITLPKKGIIRDLMNSKIVIALSRMGFAIICTVYASTYFAFLLFFVRVKLSIPTCFLVSLGNLIFNIIIVVSIYSIIELSLSILIKKLLRLLDKKRIN